MYCGKFTQMWHTQTHGIWMNINFFPAKTRSKWLMEGVVTSEPHEGWSGLNAVRNET